MPALPLKPDKTEDSLFATSSLAEKSGVKPTVAEREPSQLPITRKCCCAALFVAISSSATLFQYATKTPGESSYPYNVGSVLLVQKFCSVGIGLVLTALGGYSLKQCFEWQSIRTLLFVAILFPVANSLEMQAVADIGPVLYSLILQMKLVTIAFTSWLLLGRSYSSVQLMSLLVLMNNTGIVVSTRTDDDNYHTQNPWTVARGILLSLVGGVMMPTLAGVIQERLMKGDKSDTSVKPPFRIFMVQVSLPEALVSLVVYSIQEAQDDRLSLASFGPSQMFHGWTYLTVCLVAAQLAKFWLSSFLQKIFDTVIRQVLTVLVVVVLYVQSVMLQAGYVFELPAFLALISVLLASVSFAISTSYTDKYLTLEKAFGIGAAQQERGEVRQDGVVESKASQKLAEAEAYRNFDALESKRCEFDCDPELRPRCFSV